jgi:hypothetical protein
MFVLQSKRRVLLSLLSCMLVLIFILVVFLFLYRYCVIFPRNSYCMIFGATKAIKKKQPIFNKPCIYGYINKIWMHTITRLNIYWSFSSVVKVNPGHINEQTWKVSRFFSQSHDFLDSNSLFLLLKAKGWQVWYCVSFLIFLDQGFLAWGRFDLGNFWPGDVLTA